MINNIIVIIQGFLYYRLIVLHVTSKRKLEMVLLRGYFLGALAHSIIWAQAGNLNLGFALFVTTRN